MSSSNKLVYILKKEQQNINTTNISNNSNLINTNQTNIQNNSNAISNLQNTSGNNTFSNFTTENLPLNNQYGSIVFNTTINKPVYFNDGKWYDFSDTKIKDNTIQIYLLAGQSNAVGQAVLSDLNENQKASSNVLFYHSRHTHPTNATATQIYQSSWDTMTTAGNLGTYSNYSNTTFGNQGADNTSRFGPEIGFAKQALNINLNNGGKIGILKYAVGGTSLTNSYGSPVNSVSDWDIDTTYDGNSGRQGDCWRGFKRAIADGLSKLTNQGYSYRLAGMLWWQGENGGNATELNSFIGAVRTHLNDTYTLDMPKEQFPFVIVGTENGSWGTDFKSGVSMLSPYIGYIDSYVLSGSQNGNLHPGGQGGFLNDGNGNGNNDMYDIGVAFADKMKLAIAGTTETVGGTFTPSQVSLSMWWDFSDLSNSNSPSTITDKSNNNNDGTLSGLPLIVLNQQNNLSILRFNGNGQKYYFNQMQDIRTIFWVFNEDYNFTNANGVRQFRFVLNDNEQYQINGSNVNPHWHNGRDDDFFWSGSTNSDIKNGTLRVNGTVVNGLSTNIPTTLSIVSLRTSGNIRASSFGYDRGSTSRQFLGDLGELIISNQLLTEEDTEKVEGYLAHKWGLTNNLNTNHPYRLTHP